MWVGRQLLGFNLWIEIDLAFNVGIEIDLVFGRKRLVFSVGIGLLNVCVGG